MDNKKTRGIILILVGIGLFIISFAFVKGYDRGDGLLGSLQQMEFVLRAVEIIPSPEAPRPACMPDKPKYQECIEIQKAAEEASQKRAELNEEAMKRRIAIPYKYFFTVDIAIIFVGIASSNIT